MADVDNDLIIDKFDNFNKAIDVVEICALIKRTSKSLKKVINVGWVKDRGKINFFSNQFLEHLSIYEIRIMIIVSKCLKETVMWTS